MLQLDFGFRSHGFWISEISLFARLWILISPCWSIKLRGFTSSFCNVFSQKLANRVILSIRLLHVLAVGTIKSSIKVGRNFCGSTE